MSTISPYTQPNPTVDIATTANLGKLLAVGKKNHNPRDLVATDVAMKAFEDYKNAKLGIFHSVKKFTAVVLAYTATLGLPVGAITGGMYYMIKPLVELNADGTAKNYDLKPILNHLMGYSPVEIGLPVAAIVADLAVHQKFGWSPLFSTVKWAAWMMSTSFLYAAHTASKIVSGSFEQTEKDAEGVRKKTLKIIFENLKVSYDHMANYLAMRSKAVENNIKEKIELRHLVSQLHAKMPTILSALKEYPLQPSEISLITDQLNSVMQHILETKLSVKVPQSYEDNRNNAILLSYLPENELEGVAVPQTVDHHICEIAENNQTLGIMHKVNSYASSVVSGALTLLTAEIAIPTLAAIGSGAAALAGHPHAWNRIVECATTSDQALSCLQSTAGIVAFSALQAFSLYAGYSMYSDARSLHKLESDAATVAVEKHTHQLRSDLEQVYQGMVHYFYNGAHYPEIKDQAAKILAKMPQIESQVREIKEIADPKSITDSLKTALQLALRSDIAQMASKESLASTKAA